MAQRTHFRIARHVEAHPIIAIELDAICSEHIEQDYSTSVPIPVMNGSEDHFLRGTPRYKIQRSLALPILDIVRPEPPYRRVFNHAAMRFDDGSNTVDAQVSKKIAERWSKLYPEANQSSTIVESSGIETEFTDQGYRISALVEDGDAFQIDYDVVKDFLEYIGSMKAYRSRQLDFRPLPDTEFVPKIPLVKFNLDVSRHEVGYVQEQFRNNFPKIFRVGEIMPPKIY